MKKFKNVEYFKAGSLLIFFISIIFVFTLCAVTFSNFTKYNPVFSLLFGLIISAIYYFIVKPKITLNSNINVTSENIEGFGRNISFSNILNYRTYFMAGTARIKITMNDNTKVHLSSSQGMCDSKKFISLCKYLDKSFQNQNSYSIEKKRTFLETKTGYYTVIGLTICYLLIIAYSMFIDKELKFGSLFIGLGALAPLWSGVLRHSRK